MCKILRLFANTLTADDKYSLINRGILKQPIQMQLSQKEETFSDYFTKVSKTVLNFEYFQKNDSHIPYSSEITDCEKRGYINV